MLRLSQTTGALNLARASPPLYPSTASLPTEVVERDLINESSRVQSLEQESNMHPEWGVLMRYLGKSREQRYLILHKIEIV
jgi:hypothetical protein